MKVIFLVPYPKEGASNRYRIDQYLPYLKDCGIKYSVRSFWSSSAFKILYKKGHYFKKLYFFVLSTLSRVCDILHSIQYDIIFIHREAYPIGGAFFENILKIFKKPIIFDFDDSIFLPSTCKANKFIDRFKNPNKIAQIIKLSKYVLAGNSYLEGFALEFNRCVSVIPTPIDIEKYSIANKVKKINSNIVIGWIGSITTIDFIDELRGVFIELSKKYGNIVFKIVGGNFSINGLSNVISKSWLLDEELDDLSSFDIGIMPMPDNLWTRGKCGFKAILYMSMAVPCVCSPVGINKEIITDGVNGFLPDTEEEWVRKLSLLINSHELRQKIGAAGRKTIEERYSVKVNAPKFLEILQKVYNEEYKK